ncbi:phage scaffolding protein [Convivina praedatoris]|uniref:Phage minor structural protein GP20 n=1 Tax=Convivina praedatoris TaxID=2880963 RepID=A0ABN8H9A8_9LACO|nr:phage scaffolding protein [Convivina sp. LMG 32447]CAH1853307.1 hypothetical protein R077815_00792 [Convivina sp. LMG 32447]CAH1854673.1 hypothetical protein LMG032447_00906 [Convivina sp. LMG 32447]
MAFDTKTLTELGLTDEQVKGVMKAHGKDVNAVIAQLNDVVAERDGLNGQVSEFTKQLEEAKKAAEKDSEAANQVEQLQQQLKDSQKQAADSLAKTKLGYEVDSALLKAGALNNKAAKALIDMDKVSFGDDGKLIGLNDQLESIKNDNSFLFKATEPEQTKPGVKITPPGNPSNSNNDKPNLSSMSYKERIEFKHNDPEGYEQAVQAE